MSASAKLDQARQRFAEIDRRAWDVPLYVAFNDDPVESLTRIRQYLAKDDTEVSALAVVALDRVLDQLRGFKMRVTYELEES